MLMFSGFFIYFLFTKCKGAHSIWGCDWKAPLPPVQSSITRHHVWLFNLRWASGTGGRRRRQIGYQSQGWCEDRPPENQLADSPTLAWPICFWISLRARSPLSARAPPQKVRHTNTKWDLVPWSPEKILLLEHRAASSLSHNRLHWEK